MKLSNFTRRAVMATAAAAAFALPAQADVDMSGKTIEWTIPFSETGGLGQMGKFLCPAFVRGTAWQPLRCG